MAKAAKSWRIVVLLVLLLSLAVLSSPPPSPSPRPCPTPSAVGTPAERQAAFENPHLRELFRRYGQGDVLTPEGLHKLLLSLGLHFEDDNDHPQHTHDHQNHPDAALGSPTTRKDDPEEEDHFHDDHHHAHDDHVTHDHSPDDHNRRQKDHQTDSDGRNHGDEPKLDGRADDPYSTVVVVDHPRSNHLGDPHDLLGGHIDDRFHDDHRHSEDGHLDNNHHRDGHAAPDDSLARRSSSSSSRSLRESDATGLGARARARSRRTGTPRDQGTANATSAPQASSRANPSVPAPSTPLPPASPAAATTADPLNITTVATRRPASPKCGGVSDLLQASGLNPGDCLTPPGFLALCPGLLFYLDACRMDDDAHDHAHAPTTTSHHHHHDHEGDEFSADNWIGAITSMVVIGLVGLACIMLIPALKRSQYYDQVNHFLLALAVGTLAGDALIHLLPHAISMEAPRGSNPTLLHSFYGFTALGGIVIFLFLERCHNLFCGHGHGHGHSHGLGLDLSKSKEDIDKETVGTTTTLEDSASQITDKIGEKLSKHSKHNSFIYAESTMTLEAQNCFEGCSSNVSPSSDANGNNGPNRSRFGDDQQPTLPEKQGLVSSGDRDSEVASIDKHVAMCAEKEKLACSASEKESLVTTPADKSEIGRELSLILDTPSSGRPKVLRQNSSSFNMVLQEYHVGHHGHSHHGHSHVTGRKDSLRAMILVGDAMHTFLDGMAIGAAFGTSVTGGVATSIAVLCHELPHKVGDFALLFEMGMHLQQAIKMMALLWVLSLAGLLLGVMLGSIPTASPWIYSFTAGVFIYLALVDLLSELSVQRGEKFGVAGQLLLQGLGMLTGAVIMLIIAIYEHDLEDLLRGSF